MAWRAVAKLSLLRKSKNCVGLRGDWQLVTLTRLFLSSKNKKKKTLMNPCCQLLIFVLLRQSLESRPSVGMGSLVHLLDVGHKYGQHSHHI